jgi:hypothetical protein
LFLFECLDHSVVNVKHVQIFYIISDDNRYIKNKLFDVIFVISSTNRLFFSVRYYRFVLILHFINCTGNLCMRMYEWVLLGLTNGNKLVDYKLDWKLHSR